jgi:hypothetical protein
MAIEDNPVDVLTTDHVSSTRIETNEMLSEQEMIENYNTQLQNLKNSEIHKSLQDNLVEHLWNVAGDEEE